MNLPSRWTATENIAWRLPLPAFSGSTPIIWNEYGRFGLNWGYGSSPLLHNDALYVQVLHGMKTDAPSYLLAIEKLTGKTRWRIERPTDAVSESHDAYTTPALLRHNGKEDDRGILWCRDAKTGAEIWGSQRVRSGTYSASPVIADGKLFVISEDGVTTVREAGPEFKVLAENDLAEYTLSSPAISDGQIFLRTQAALYCIGRRTTTSK